MLQRELLLRNDYPVKELSVQDVLEVNNGLLAVLVNGFLFAPLHLVVMDDDTWIFLWPVVVTEVRGNVAAGFLVIVFRILWLRLVLGNVLHYCDLFRIGAVDFRGIGVKHYHSRIIYGKDGCGLFFGVGRIEETPSALDGCVKTRFNCVLRLPFILKFLYPQVNLLNGRWGIVYLRVGNVKRPCKERVQDCVRKVVNDVEHGFGSSAFRCNVFVPLVATRKFPVLAHTNNVISALGVKVTQELLQAFQWFLVKRAFSFHYAFLHS